MKQTDSRRGEVLVAILNNARDLNILQQQGWYRVPVDTAPKHWPPKWLAFYQTAAFGKEKYAVNYYGRVREIRTATRRELLPSEFPHKHWNREYYQVFIEKVERLTCPIPSRRWRRITFITTTWFRFKWAKEINDLYIGSNLEEKMWAELRKLDIPAEREFEFGDYMLDFAIHCKKGNLDVETDGDDYHANAERAARDNKRNNALEAAGWHVLRFSEKQIKDQMQEYCIPKINETTSNLGGIVLPGQTTPTLYYDLSGKPARQLALFEERAAYDWD